MSFFVVAVKGWRAPRWPPPSLLTGVLRYLGCLLPGLNGHIVLLPATAPQTTRSSAHTCQAMSLAPWVLRNSRAPLLHTWSLNPCAPTHKSSRMCTSDHMWLCRLMERHRYVYMRKSHKQSMHTLTHLSTHTLSKTWVYWKHTSLPSPIPRLYSVCRSDLEFRRGQVPYLSGWGGQGHRRLAGLHMLAHGNRTEK